MKVNNLTGIFTLVVGRGATVGEKMINDHRIPLISFTGSTRMGKKIAEATAKRLARSLLELGGNNAIIVAEDANIDLVVPAVLFGAIGTAGQRCTTTRRLIVHESIVDNLTQKLVKTYEQIRIGDPLDENKIMGPLVDQDAEDNMMKALKSVPDEGGQIIFGGKKIDQSGFYFTPCLVIV
ncbi:hypothetical protein LCGC14_1190390 [marine sediment metagenome]|uniref:aldehyde dehydrogenase (NAD(+)) n=1 Tax=marine sediment metagenome TaxID=412755 RepID=A0A0F9LJH9_9ZZZZ